jgi:hypothetical protein
LVPAWIAALAVLAPVVLPAWPLAEPQVWLPVVPLAVQVRAVLLVVLLGELLPPDAPRD